MTDLTLRPIADRDELDLFNHFPYVLNEELAGDLDAGRRRTDWMWVALRGDRPVGRLAWWSRPDRDAPHCLDIFDLDPAVSTVDDGVALLRAAFATTLPAGDPPPDYLRFLPPGWRADEGTRRGVADRRAALERTGARLFVERLRLQWSAGGPVPAPNDRLRFRAADDRAELIGLMARVLGGTLDAHSRRDLHRTASAERVAADQYHGEFAHYQRHRDWWRIGVRPDGEPVGFVIPAHNGYHPVIAYLGVVPAHRGQGYVDDLLAEGTRILAAQGVPRIRAATDLDNAPMAQAFQRAGYQTFERQLCLTWAV